MLILEEGLMMCVVFFSSKRCCWSSCYLFCRVSCSLIFKHVIAAPKDLPAIYSMSDAYYLSVVVWHASYYFSRGVVFESKNISLPTPTRKIMLSCLNYGQPSIHLLFHSSSGCHHSLLKK